MAEESYLGAIERHGIRGGLTAQERITKATEDSLCARCQTNTVVQPNNPAKVKRLCQSCQIKLQNDPTARYFP